MKRHERIQVGVAGTAWALLTAALVVLFLGWGFEQSWAADLSAVTMKRLLSAGLTLELACFIWGCQILARTKQVSQLLLLFGLLGPPAQFILWLALIIKGDPDSSPRGRDYDDADHGGTPLPAIGRLIRLPRVKALLWIVAGLLGIGVAVFLTQIYFLRNRENQILLAMAVFFLGYVAVLRGSWWLITVKGWDDAVLFIGLMPLTIFIIPIGIVRALVITLLAPLLPPMMVMAPLILLVIVLVLPDKNGGSRRRRRRRR